MCTNKKTLAFSGLLLSTIILFILVISCYWRFPKIIILEVSPEEARGIIPLDLRYATNIKIEYMSSFRPIDTAARVRTLTGKEFAVTRQPVAVERTDDSSVISVYIMPSEDVTTANSLAIFEYPYPESVKAVIVSMGRKGCWWESDEAILLNERQGPGK